MDQSYLVFKDRETEKENTYKSTTNSDGSITLAEVTGTVYEAGTPQDAARFNSGRQQALAAYVLSQVQAVHAHWNQQEAENSRITDCVASQALTAGTAATIAIPASALRNHTGYTPIINILTATAATSIKVSDKQLNGFKLTAVGGDCTVYVGVRGGIW